MTYHYLKTWKPYFQEILDCVKTFEYRYDDRKYLIGDILILAEYDQDKFTGRTICKEIGFILYHDWEFEMVENYVIMSLLPYSSLDDPNIENMINDHRIRYDNKY